MDREVLKQIWPIFSAEAREHLQTISSAILELERDPASPVLDAIRRTAHSLKGSAGSLGLGDVEMLAHALEGSLAGFDPAAGLSRAAVQVSLDALEAMEAAIGAGDAGAGCGASDGADTPAITARAAAGSSAPGSAPSAATSKGSASIAGVAPASPAPIAASIASIASSDA